MQFISGLLVSKLDQAFELISISNTEEIKKGQWILSQLKTDPSFYSLICNYICKQGISEQNKLKAILQLRDYTQLLYDQEFNSNHFDNLLSIYLQSNDKVSKILIQIFKFAAQFDMEVMKNLVDKFQTYPRYSIKILKLFQKLYRVSFHQIQLEIKKIMVQHVLDILQNNLQKGFENDEPAQFFYRIFKIIQLICLQNSSYQIFQIKDRSQQLAKLAVIMLNQPDPQLSGKYSIKMKISAMKCLINLCNGRYNSEQIKRINQFSSSVWENYIDNPLYTGQCFAYLKILALNRIYTQMFPDKQALTQVIQKVLEMAVKYIHNQKQLLNKLQADPQDYILLYMINEDVSDITNQAKNNIQILASSYYQIWLQTIDSWSSPPISNSVLILIVQSLRYNKYNKLLKGEFFNKSIQIYNKNIRDNFGALFQKATSDVRLNETQTIRFICELRFVKTFLEFFNGSQLKLVCMLCSKMALKSQLLSSLCYFVINDIMKLLNKKYSQLPLQQLGEVYCDVLEDMKSNQDNITINDIYLIQSGLKSLQRQVQMIRLLKEPLKCIIMILCKLLDTNKQFNVIDITFSIMNIYLQKIGYQADFKNSIQSCVKERFFTPYLVKCYMIHIKQSNTNLTSAEDIIIQMSGPQYWKQNLQDGKVNARLFSSLIKIIPNTSPYYSQILPNFISNVQRITLEEGGNYTSQQNHLLLDIIQTVMELSSEMIIQTGVAASFYNLIMNYQGFKNRAENTYLKMMSWSIFPPSQQGFHLITILILRGRKVRINNKNFNIFISLLFKQSQQLINITLDNGQKFDFIWWKFLQKMMKFIIGKNIQAQRLIFTQQLMDFVNVTKVDLKTIIPEIHQQKLTNLCQSSFSQNQQ